MRSRFSAYALSLADYIIETTFPAGPCWKSDRTSWRNSIECYCRSNHFGGLSILESPDTDDSAATAGEVLFTAEIVGSEGSDRSFTERSQFLRVNGRWLYHSGEAP
jgi:SEC-C motif-containing protein